LRLLNNSSLLQARKHSNSGEALYGLTKKRKEAWKSTSDAMEPLDGKYSEGLVGADEKARKRKLTQLERLDICTRSGVMFDTNVEEETFLEHEGKLSIKIKHVINR
jgi:hypothetical protein